MFSTVIATRARGDYLMDALASLEALNCPDIIIVVNHCPETMKKLSAYEYFASLTIIDLPKNIGAGRGKHEGIRRAKYDKILIIDDDAVVLDGSDLSYCLEKLADYSVVQGLILADDKSKRRRYEQPFMFAKNRLGDHKISYFVGAAHFIHRPDFLAAGGYEKAALYGFEELELSLNLLHAGKRLLFTDKFRVHHKKAAAGRTPPKEQMRNMLRTRNRIAVEYFPWPVALISQTIWNIKLLPRTGALSFTRQKGIPLIGWKDFFRVPRLFSRALV